MHSKPRGAKKGSSFVVVLVLQSINSPDLGQNTTLTKIPPWSGPGGKSRFLTSIPAEMGQNIYE